MYTSIYNIRFVGLQVMNITPHIIPHRFYVTDILITLAFCQLFKD